MLLSDAEIRNLCLEGCSREGWPAGPMIEPFSEAVSGGGVISFGLSHAGYDLRLGPEILLFKNSSIMPSRFTQ